MNAKLSVTLAILGVVLAVEPLFAAPGTVTVDCANNQGVLVRTGQNASAIQTFKGPLDQQLVNDLHLQKVRVLFKMNSLDGWGGKTLWDQLNQAGADIIFCTVHGSIPGDVASCRNQISTLQSWYPDMEISIEVMNEPDLDGVDIGDFNASYHRIAEAVAQINSPNVKVGGCAMAEYHWWDQAWYEKAFLRYVIDNQLRLDFYTYHDYLHEPDYVVRHLSCGRAVRALLNQTGFRNLPVYITECGHTPWVDYNGTSPGDNRVAAHSAAACYFWMEAGVAAANHFALHDYAGSTRSVLTAVKTSGQDGKVNARYNVLWMWSRLKANRVAAAGTPIQLDPSISNYYLGWQEYSSATGHGVAAIGTMDETGVAVMFWNFQQYGWTGYDVTVSVQNLPANFSQGNVRMERYLIDATHSNYANDPDRDKLEKVENTVLGPMSTYSSTVAMGANSVCLVVLTPDVGGQSTAVTPSISASADATDGPPRVTVSGATIRYTTDGTTPTVSSGITRPELSIFTCDGRRVARLAGSGSAAQERSFAWNIPSRAAGVYMVRVVEGKKELFRRFTAGSMR